MSIQKRIIVSILSFLSMFVGTVGCYGAWVLSDFNHDGKFPSDGLGIDDDTHTDDSITNFALFGIDARSDDETARSDSIIILTIDNKHNKIKLTSILRDSYVYVDGDGYTGYTKINHAYSFGGPELAVKTINQNFKLDIKEYATVDFTGMADIIDGVGGVEIDISQLEANHANGSIRETCKDTGREPEYMDEVDGVQLLTGMQAVEYARIRYIDSDFGRADRQRTVLEKLFLKALDMNITQYPALAKNLLPYATTSLSLSEILAYVPALSNNPTMEKLNIPEENTDENPDNWYDYQEGGVSYVRYDLDEASETIKKFIYEDSYTPSSSTSSSNSSRSTSSSSSKSTYSYTPPASSYSQNNQDTYTYTPPATDDNTTTEVEPDPTPTTPDPTPTTPDPGGGGGGTNPNPGGGGGTNPDPGNSGDPDPGNSGDPDPGNSGDPDPDPE